MSDIILDRLREPWPWYVAGPLIGLLVPALLLVGNWLFGVSSSFRHACAALLPGNAPYFRYDWRKELWYFWFVGGIVLGGWIAVHVLAGDVPAELGDGARRWLTTRGIDPAQPLVPQELFGAAAFTSARGWIVLLGGGFLVGFGARYAGGCTGGHAISGIATLQSASIIATLAFFAGGLITSWLFIPLLMGGAAPGLSQ